MSQQSIVDLLSRRRKRNSSSDYECKPMSKRLSVSTPNIDTQGTEPTTETITKQRSSNKEGEMDRESEKGIKALLLELKDSQDRMKASFEQRLSNLEKSIKGKMDDKFKDLKDYVEVEVEILNKKIMKLDDRVKDFENLAISNQTEQFSPDVTVVAINLMERSNENIDEVVSDMISNGLCLPEIAPARVLRLKGKDGKPGIVKIQCLNKEDKISILRAKRNLADCSRYKKVFLRTSMSHSDRMMKLNFETILKELPGGNRYRIAGNGRIIANDDDNEYNKDGDSGDRRNNRGQGFRYRGNGRGRGRGNTLRGRGRGGNRDSQDE
jgi:hypothetical protein